MAVKKGLKGLLNQGSQEMLAAMQRDAEAEGVATGTDRGGLSVLPVPAPAGPTSPVVSTLPPAVTAAPVIEEAPESPAAAVSAAPARQKAPRARPTPSPAAAAPEAAPDEAPVEPEEAPQAKKPSWEEMDRKEVRVYSDQVLALTTLRLRINKGKKGSERITDNTLIRTAIDLLLERQEELGGVTENEIRASCGLNPRY